MNNRKITTMIVEDEPGSLELLSELIESTGLASVVASTTEPSEALNMLEATVPELLFLDIRMPGMSGFDILNEMNRQNGMKPRVVFTTAHDEYAIRAFDYAAFDYLLKPIDPDRLLETLKRHKSNDEKKRNETAHQPEYQNEKILIFRGITGVTFIDTDDVVFITADGNYSGFHFISGRVETVTSLLGNIETQLGRHFYRTSRSCIINTSYLARIDMKQMTCIFIRGEREFRCDISRDKVKTLMEHMKNLISEG